MKMSMNHSPLYLSLLLLAFVSSSSRAFCKNKENHGAIVSDSKYVVNFTCNVKNKANTCHLLDRETKQLFYCGVRNNRLCNCQSDVLFDLNEGQLYQLNVIHKNKLICIIDSYKKVKLTKGTIKTDTNTLSYKLFYDSTPYTSCYACVEPQVSEFTSPNFCKFNSTLLTSTFCDEFAFKNLTINTLYTLYIYDHNGIILYNYSFPTTKNDYMFFTKSLSQPTKYQATPNSNSNTNDYYSAQSSSFYSKNFTLTQIDDNPVYEYQRFHYKIAYNSQPQSTLNCFHYVTINGKPEQLTCETEQGVCDCSEGVYKNYKENYQLIEVKAESSLGPVIAAFNHTPHYFVNVGIDKFKLVVSTADQEHIDFKCELLFAFDQPDVRVSLVEYTGSPCFGAVVYTEPPVNKVRMIAQYGYTTYFSGYVQMLPNITYEKIYITRNSIGLKIVPVANVMYSSYTCSFYLNDTLLAKNHPCSYIPPLNNLNYSSTYEFNIFDYNQRKVNSIYFETASNASTLVVKHISGNRCTYNITYKKESFLNCKMRWDNDTSEYFDCENTSVCSCTTGTLVNCPHQNLNVLFLDYNTDLIISTSEAGVSLSSAAIIAITVTVIIICFGIGLAIWISFTDIE